MENKVEILLSEQEVIDLLIKQDNLFVIHKEDVITPYDELVEDGEEQRLKKGDTIICKDKEYRVVKLNKIHIEELGDMFELERLSEFEGITMATRNDKEGMDEQYIFVINE